MLTGPGREEGGKGLRSLGVPDVTEFLAEQRESMSCYGNAFMNPYLSNATQCRLYGLFPSLPDEYLDYAVDA